MAYPLSDYMPLLHDIVTEVRRLTTNPKALSKEEILLLQRLSDLLDHISDEITLLIKSQTRH